MEMKKVKAFNVYQLKLLRMLQTENLLIYFVVCRHLCSSHVFPLLILFIILASRILKVERACVPSDGAT